MATYTFHIPHIVNGQYQGKMIYAVVPVECSKCGKKRGGIVKRFSNPTYGSILRAKCAAGCDESYEDLCTQAENYKKNNTLTLKPDFFKGKMEEWKPDTRTGSSNKNYGMNCANKICNEFYSYVEPNQENGTYLCRKCRGII